MNRARKHLGLPILLFCLSLATMAGAGENWKGEISKLAGNGSVLITDSSGREILSLNPDKAMIPASTLKVVTAAAALETLGPDFRFATEFYLTPGRDLYVVGKGDPFLVSEELETIAAELKTKGISPVRQIYLNNGYFAPGLVLHGTSRSLNPYDAYNGALCVNFNTIYVQVERGGVVKSAEHQTPLTGMAEDMAKKSGVTGKVRFNLAENPRTCLLYAGDLIKTFLELEGVEVTGGIEPADQLPDNASLVYRHQSRLNLSGMIARLFKYSNNFMTNQVFLTMGAEKYGPPAEVQKSQRVINDFLTTHGIPPFHMEEGSGLSRRTTLSSRQMMLVLQQFLPYRNLMTREGSLLYKTGTLSDVKSVVGYVMPESGHIYYFTVFLNGSQFSRSSRERILNLLEENLS
jgi:D-alanyl-D-alanine carboxypeptidase/D-alanyl-D-alanine-endopeptidase (penicillin-binding protein 4)